uniref:ParB/RepB/Spo0J family partition protein n=1 Tax=Acetatifactor sp. TaxID=1872090 RepID=UPI0040566D89
MNKSAAKIKPVSLDELLGVGSTETMQTVNNMEAGNIIENSVVEIPIEQLHPFRNHPFRVLDDEKMAETVDSINQYGVLVPGIVRSRREGGYEIISGHRRRRGSQLAGRTTMPVLIKELSDAEATVIMVDSNIQREDLLPSEKAKAYQMKYEALKELGLSENEGDKRLDQALAEKSGESRNTIQRYIRLNNLVPELLEMVDAKRLGFIAATDISYLKEDEQKMLLLFMQANNIVPVGTQAEKLKEYSKSGNLNEAVMELVLKEEKQTNKLVIKEKQLKSYFPENYDISQMTEIIFTLLDEWKNKERNKL